MSHIAVDCLPSQVGINMCLALSVSRFAWGDLHSLMFLIRVRDQASAVNVAVASVRIAGSCVMSALKTGFMSVAYF